MQRLINYEEEIDKYNDSQNDYFYQIYPMSELDYYLSEYGYTDEDFNIDIIDDNNFSDSDDYFWLNYQNGYLYSGSAKEVYHILIKNDIDMIDIDTNNEKFYRYEIVINNKSYGFIQGIDTLLELNLISQSIARKINSYFSELKVPPANIMNDNTKNYFTEQGFKHFQFAFKIIIPELEKVCKVNLLTLNKNDVKDKIKYRDDYQIAV